MSAKKSEKTDPVPFEDAMARLEEIVSNLEGGELGLETSLASFEEGMKLAKVCEDRLSEASGRVEKIMKDFSGMARREALSDDELGGSESKVEDDNDGF